MNSFRFIIIYTLCFFINKSVAQNDFMDYTTPREYTLAAITVDGVVHFDHDMIIQKSGLVRSEEVSALMPIRETPRRMKGKIEEVK